MMVKAAARYKPIMSHEISYTCLYVCFSMSFLNFFFKIDTQLLIIGPPHCMREPERVLKCMARIVGNVIVLIACNLVMLKDSAFLIPCPTLRIQIPFLSTCIPSIPRLRSKWTYILCTSISI